MLHNRSI